MLRSFVDSEGSFSMVWRCLLIIAKRFDNNWQSGNEGKWKTKVKKGSAAFTAHPKLRESFKKRKCLNDSCFTLSNNKLSKSPRCPQQLKIAMRNFWLKTWSGEIMFSIMAHNRRRGWQNFEILSTSEPITSAKIESRISQDYILCYISRALDILGEEKKILRKKFWIWEFFSKIL